MAIEYYKSDKWYIIRNMKEVYITGHRNPDLDSICSAYAYSVLKTKTDPAHEYVPVRCGHLSDSVKDQLARVGVSAVAYKRDVKAKVRDVMNTVYDIIEADDPVYQLVRQYDASRPSAMPVFENGSYYGLLSIDDITGWFLKDNSKENPLYNLSLANIEKVLEGHFVKKSHDLEGVQILVGAATIEDFQKAVDDSCNAVVVMGFRREHINWAIEKNVPAIILTASEGIKDVDLSSYTGSVFVTGLLTAEAIRRLRMAVRIREIVVRDTVRLDVNTLFDDAKDLLVSSKRRGLSVFEGETFCGFVTRRCFLSKPVYNVILVDHNEAGQSIRGLEEARVREIIDHHRLDALKTDLPIFIDSEPLGSTCTIVYQQFVRHSIVPDEYTAKVLLTGIISDTLILRSPTTTQIDRSSAGSLAALCGIFDIQGFGEKLFSGAQSLASRDPLAVIASDFKKYNERGLSVGVGQCEATTLKDIADYKDDYLANLEAYRVKNGLDWAMLMVTDVLREKSLLLITDFKLNRKLPYAKLYDLVYDMPGIMSRKKQLLPEIIHTMDQV